MEKLRSSPVVLLHLEEERGYSECCPGALVEHFRPLWPALQRPDLPFCVCFSEVELPLKKDGFTSESTTLEALLRGEGVEKKVDAREEDSIQEIQVLPRPQRPPAQPSGPGSPLGGPQRSRGLPMLFQFNAPLESVPLPDFFICSFQMYLLSLLSTKYHAKSWGHAGKQSRLSPRPCEITAHSPGSRLCRVLASPSESLTRPCPLPHNTGSAPAPQTSGSFHPVPWSWRREYLVELMRD